MEFDTEVELSYTDINFQVILCIDFCTELCINFDVEFCPKVDVDTVTIDFAIKICFKFDHNDVRVRKVKDFECWQNSRFLYGLLLFQGRMTTRITYSCSVPFTFTSQNDLFALSNYTFLDFHFINIFTSPDDSSMSTHVCLLEKPVHSSLQNKCWHAKSVTFSTQYCWDQIWFRIRYESRVTRLTYQLLDQTVHQL